MNDSRPWPMWQRITVRIALFPLIFVAVSATSYFLLYGPFEEEPQIGLYAPGTTQEDIEQLRDELGLNDPWYDDYVVWLREAVQGDFGRNHINYGTISELLTDAAEPSIEITLVALTVAAFLAWSLIVLYERARNDAALILAALLSAMPLLLAMALIVLVPFDLWDYAPPQESTSISDGPGGIARRILPPAIALGIVLSGVVFAFARAQRAASASMSASMAHAAVSTLPLLLLGLFVVEFAYGFGVRGIGFVLLTSAIRHDYATIQALVSTIGTFMIGVAMFVSLWQPTIARRERVAPTRLRRDALLIVGAALVAASVIAAMVGPELTADPFTLREDAAYGGPSLDHPFGTHAFGRDVLANVLHSMRSSLRFALAALVCGFVPGAIIGAAIANRWPSAKPHIDAISMYIWFAPAILIAVLFVATWDHGFWPVVAAASFTTLALGLRAGARVAISRDLRSSVLDDLPALVEGACWAMAFAIVFEISAYALTETFHRVALLVRIGINNESPQWQHLIAPAVTLTLMVFGFLLIAMRLAAWRLEAQAQAASFARFRRPQ